MLERSFPLVWVSGEVSNFTRAASGHWYFSIKDAQAQMRCVMFRGRAQYAEFTPREGDRIEVRALVTMYEPRGELQLNVEAVRRTGQGRLLRSVPAAEGAARSRGPVRRRAQARAADASARDRHRHVVAGGRVARRADDALRAARRIFR